MVAFADALREGAADAADVVVDANYTVQTGYLRFGYTFEPAWADVIPFTASVTMSGMIFEPKISSRNGNFRSSQFTTRVGLARSRSK